MEVDTGGAASVILKCSRRSTDWTTASELTQLVYERRSGDAFRSCDDVLAEFSSLLKKRIQSHTRLQLM